MTSQHAFTGLVTATTNNGRVATVHTDAGLTVTVIGTPAEGSAATTVDRQYVVGTRYEFHPLNDASPYQDNVCTATREVAGGSSSPSAGVSGHAAATGPDQPFRRLPIAAMTGAVAALLLAGLLFRARRAAARAPTADR